MEESKYFTRKINEGTVKRTHICSFDKSIKLEMIVTGSKRVIDYIIKAQATAMMDEKSKETKAELTAKESFLKSLAGLRINGLPIVYEDLDKCFDSEEILEIMAFINDGDMSDFGGDNSSEPKND